MLSTLAIPPGNEGDPTERIETTRLSFAIIAEAMRDHPQNKDHFEVRRIHKYPCVSTTMRYFHAESSWV